MILFAILDVSFFLSVVFRYFLVLYAEGFVKKGTLDVKLLKQIYWLVWVVLVTIGLVPFLITPIVLDDFPRDKFRGQLCLGVFVPEDENESQPDHLFLQPHISMALMVFYMVRFNNRVKKYIHGNCPRQRVSCIGKYKRNVIGLKTTYTTALALHCFTFAIKFFRQPTKYLSASNAFLVNYIVLDSFIYLFAFCVFLYARRQDIPDREDAKSQVDFYLSKNRPLQPRRPNNNLDSKNNNHCFYNIAAMNYQEKRKSSLETHVLRTKEPRSDDYLTPDLCQNLKLLQYGPDGLWIWRKAVDNKVHPTVTIYSSKQCPLHVNSKSNNLQTAQAKTKVFSPEPRKYVEMPPIVNDNLSYNGFALQANSAASIICPTDFLLHSSSENSSGMVTGKVSGQCVTTLSRRFSYLKKSDALHVPGC